MKLLFCSRPAYGHLYPLMPTALAAREAGDAAQRKLRRQRSLKLALSGTCTDAAGNAAKLSGSATLKR